MKNTVLLAFIISFGLWSCKKKGKDPAPKTLADSVNYTNFVKPIITKNCALAGCHALATGIDLRTYDKVKTQAQTGKLIAAIKHEAIALPMPEGSAKLSDRDILIFETWKSKGCPEN